MKYLYVDKEIYHVIRTMFVCLFVSLDAFIEGKWVSHQGFSFMS